MVRTNSSVVMFPLWSTSKSSANWWISSSVNTQPPRLLSISFAKSVSDSWNQRSRNPRKLSPFSAALRAQWSTMLPRLPTRWSTGAARKNSRPRCRTSSSTLAVMRTISSATLAGSAPSSAMARNRLARPSAPR